MVANIDTGIFIASPDGRTLNQSSLLEDQGVREEYGKMKETMASFTDTLGQTPFIKHLRRQPKPPSSESMMRSENSFDTAFDYEQDPHNSSASVTTPPTFTWTTTTRGTQSTAKVLFCSAGAAPRHVNCTFVLGANHEAVQVTARPTNL
jgi:hypothetical protein